MNLLFQRTILMLLCYGVGVLSAIIWKGAGANLQRPSESVTDDPPQRKSVPATQKGVDAGTTVSAMARPDKATLTPAVHSTPLALDAWKSMTNPAQQKRAVFDVIKQLARAGGEGALQFAQSLPNSPWKQQAIGEALRQSAAVGDPAKLAASVSHRFPADDRAHAAEQVAKGWADKDVAAAVRWALSLPSGVEQESAIAGVMSTWCEKDPKQAIHWLAQHTEATAWEEYVGRAAATWASREPAAALAWATAQADSAEEQAEGRPFVKAVLGKWTENDPASAGNALLRSAPELGSELGKEIAAKWAEISPKEALAWAKQFTDPQTRLHLVLQVKQVWAGFDPQAADTATRGEFDNIWEKES